MRKKTMKSLAALFLVAIFTLATLVVASAATDDTLYNFEKDAQGWKGRDNVDEPNSTGTATAKQVTSKAFQGNGSLEVTLGTGYKNYQVLGPHDALEDGKTFTFHVFIPKGTGLQAIQAFVQSTDGWTWYDGGSWTNAEEDKWLTVTLPVDDTIDYTNIMSFGLQFVNSDVTTEEKVVYVDSIDEGSGAADEGNDDGDDDDDEEPVETGYGSLIPLILMAGASGVVLLKSRKK